MRCSTCAGSRQLSASGAMLERTLFYLCGVAPTAITTGAIYRGVAPFIVLQLIGLIMLAAFPALATWLPGWLYR